MIWMKFIHIAAISIWSAGLICLPGLYVQRAHVAGEASLHRLQALVRFLYVGAMSPAAFIGIASGTAVIFMRDVYAPWFSVKLVFVGVMATIHILTGLVIIRLFDEGQVYPVWRFIAVTIFTVFTISVVLFLVLAKPDVPNMLPAAMSEPGGLREILWRLIPALKS